MGLVVPAVLVALIPVGALTSAAFDPAFPHRSRFGLRFAAFVLGTSFPELLLLLGSAVGIAGSDPVLPLLIGLLWGLALLVLAPLLLFQGPGAGPGPSGEDGEDPGSGGDRPSPGSPIGGLPLPDAEQSALRLRGPRRLKPGRGARRRNREPDRAPVPQPHPR